MRLAGDPAGAAVVDALRGPGPRFLRVERAVSDLAARSAADFEHVVLAILDSLHDEVLSQIPAGRGGDYDLTVTRHLDPGAMTQRFTLFARRRPVGPAT